MNARDELRGTLSNTICNASNYTKRAQPHLLGSDMSVVLDKTADAILASGYRKVPNSEEDIERAAKAVYDLDGRAGAWETRDEEIRELYREDARAVAAALGFPVLHEGTQS